MRGVETLLILALVASVACVGQGSSVSTDLHVGEPGLPIPTPVAAKHEGEKARILALQDKGGVGFSEPVDWSEIEDAEWAEWGRCAYDPDGWFFDPVSAVEVRMPEGRRVTIYVVGYDVCG